VIELQQLESRNLFAVTILPMPGSFIAGTAGYQVEFRQANFELNMDASQVDALFALATDSPNILSQAFDNGVEVIHYLDDEGSMRFPSITPRDIDNVMRAGTPIGGFNEAEDNNLALVARGFLFIPQRGTWNFTVGTDDEFRLVMGANRVVVARLGRTDDDASATGRVVVETPGYFPFELTWSHRHGPMGLDFYANGPGQRTDHLVGDPDGSLRVSRIIATAPSTIESFTGALARTTLRFTDANPNAGADRFTATINWGDDTSSAVVMRASDADGTFVLAASHVYAVAGNFTVSATVSDADDGQWVTTMGTATITPPGRSPPAPEQPPVTATVIRAGPSPDLSNQQLVLVLTRDTTQAQSSSSQSPLVAAPPSAGDQREGGSLASMGGTANTASTRYAGGGTQPSENLPAVPPVAEAPAVRQPDRFAHFEERAEQRRFDLSAAVSSPLTPRAGIAVEDAVFLDASSGTVDVDCAFGEPISLLPTDEVAVPEGYPPGALDDEVVMLTVLWFVATTMVGISE
jgi:hypothetical protein